MRALLFSAAFAGMVLGCGGSSVEPVQPGPLKLGIIAGQNQVAKAGSSQLGAPVVGQLVRQPNGVVAFRWYDAVLPTKAYAQTTVKGSPVPGAVVCAVSVTPGQMVPFVPCTNTDENGTAIFFFTPGTKSGEARSEIRGTLAGSPAVFDTAKATVTPDVPAEIKLIELVVNGSVATRSVAAGGTVDVHTLIAYVRDQYANFIAPATSADVSDQGLAQSTTSITPQWSVRDGSETTALAPDSTGWTATFPKGMAGKRVTLYVWAGVVRSSLSFDVK